MKMERGISIIGAVFTLLVLAIFGAAIVALVTADSESRFRQTGKEQAFYEVQAGLEYAVHEINNGGYPVVTNKALGRGSFSNTVDFANHYVFSTGTSGEISKTHQITVNPMGGDCITVDPSGETLSGPSKTDLSGITITKTCLNAVTIDRMMMSWTPNGSERITKVTLDGVEVYDNVTGMASGGSIDLTDYSISNSSTHYLTLVQFTGNMLGKQLRMTLYPSDTSYKTSVVQLVK